MTPGMLDAILDFHLSELRRSFGQNAAAAANAFRSSNFLTAYDFFPASDGHKGQTIEQQSQIIRSAKTQDKQLEQGKVVRVKP